MAKKQTKQDLIDILVNVYHQDESKLKKKTKLELEEILIQNQKEKVKASKNPNKFFIIKDLPPPKVYETKTSSKGGWLVFAAFIAIFLAFAGLAVWRALK